MASETLVQLVLVGKPCLYVNGQPVEVGPPAAYEVLARVLLAGHAGIGRKELHAQIWGDRNPANASGQLRINLMKLRSIPGMTEIVDLEKQSLVVRPHVSVAVDILGELPEARHLLRQLKPVAQGWPPERWVTYADRYGERVAERLMESEEPVDVELLRRACELFPTTANLHRLLVNDHRRAGREAEAQEVIIRFEESWVDRFGHLEIPQFIREHPVPPAAIETPNPGTRAPAPPPAERRRTMVPWALVATGILIAAWFRARPARPVPVTYALPDIHVLSRDTLHFQGHNIERIRLESGLSPIRLGYEQRDGSLILEQTVPGKDDLNQMWSLHNQKLVRVPFPLDLERVDQIGEQILANGPPSIALTGLPDGRWIAVKKNPALPHSSWYAVFPDGSHLMWRHCDHPTGDHFQLSIVKQGVERLITTRHGVAQVTVTTDISPRGIFFHYSYGKREQWRFHQGWIPVKNGVPQSTKIEELYFEKRIVADFTNGTRFLMPQSTSVMDGDCTTTDTGEVLICAPGRAVRSLQVGKSNQFGGVFRFGEVAMVVLSHRQAARSHITFVDAEGREVPRSVGLPHVINSVGISLYRNYLFIETVESTHQRHIYDVYAWH